MAKIIINIKIVAIRWRLIGEILFQFAKIGIKLRENNLSQFAKIGIK
jgi:nucleoside diphosphate kinase